MRKLFESPQDKYASRAWCLAIVAAGSTTNAAILPAVANAAPIRECGNYNSHFGVAGSPAGIINLTTRNVRCGPAYSLSLRVTAKIAWWMSRMSFQGFICRFTQLQPELTDMRCVKRSQVIHWQTGA